MVESKENLKLPDVSPEVNPQEQFITKLYRKTLDWLKKDQKWKVLAEFPDQYIPEWKDRSGLDPGSARWFSIDLEKGVIVQTEDRIFALVIGKELPCRYGSERTLSFQFGMLPLDSVMDRQDKDIHMARMLTQQRLWSYGSGEFFVDDVTGKVRIACWADGLRFSGGQEIKRWPQEELLTDKGANACLEIIQRTSRNAFIR